MTARSTLAPPNRTLFLITATLLLLLCSSTATSHAAPRSTGQGAYVGSLACKKCHEKEYASFKAYAKKSKSFQSIERLKKGLSSDDLKKCYSCHTTGYGKPGGFISPEKTPHLKNAGCEVCHGPGELHIKTKDRTLIKNKLSSEDCESCHTSERVNSFRFKPLIHGGGH